MAKDTFRWVAQNPGDTLTRKLNSEINQAEDNGYELEDKEVLQKPEDGNDNKAIILLHFTKPKYDSADYGTFLQAVDISMESLDDDYDFNKADLIQEEIAEVVGGIRENYPNHQIVDMELDEGGKILYLMFEPF